MQIKIIKKSVYGNELIYPVGDNATSITQLTGKKTLTISDLKALQALGHEIEQEQDKINL